MFYFMVIYEALFKWQASYYHGENIFVAFYDSYGKMLLMCLTKTWIEVVK